MSNCVSVSALNRSSTSCLIYHLNSVHGNALANQSTKSYFTTMCFQLLAEVRQTNPVNSGAARDEKLFSQLFIRYWKCLGALLLWGMQVGLPKLQSISRCGVFFHLQRLSHRKEWKACGLTSNWTKAGSPDITVCCKVMLLFIFWHVNQPWTWIFSVVHKSAAVEELLVTNAVSAVQLDWSKAAAYKHLHVLQFLVCSTSRQHTLSVLVSIRHSSLLYDLWCVSLQCCM